MDINNLVKRSFEQLLALQPLPWDNFEIDLELSFDIRYGSMKFVKKFFLNEEYLEQYELPDFAAFDLNIWYCIYISNRNGTPFNRIIYKTKKEQMDEAECELIFDQVINDNLIAFFKKKKLPTTPWWENPEQVNKLKDERIKLGLENFEI